MTPTDSESDAANRDKANKGSMSAATKRDLELS